MRIATAVADGFSLLEGPRWANGALYVSDFFSHRVLRFGSPIDGRHSTVCEVAGQPSGLEVAADGTVYVASMNGMSLMRWDGTELSSVASLAGLVSGPLNDMAMDSGGRVYIGNFGLKDGHGTTLDATRLIRVDPDGSTSIAAEDLVFPNGIVFSADGQTMFVAETYRGQVTAFDVLEHGRLGARRIWASFGPEQAPMDVLLATEQLPVLPDGLAIDIEGALWVGDAKGHGIARMAEGGKQLDFVETGSLSVYAATLGGPDMTTLFLCCAPPAETFDAATEHRSVLMSCPVDVPGVARP